MTRTLSSGFPGGVLPAVAAALVTFVLASGCDRSGQSKSPDESHDSVGSGGGGTKPGPNPISRSASLSQIRQFISTGRRDEAQASIQRHLLQFPDDPNAMVLASGLLKTDGLIDDAVAMLESAANADPGQKAKWRRQAAAVLYDAGRPLEAIARLESMLAEQPELDDVRHELVAMLNGRGFRFDANRHVRQLCRRGQARLDELQGLMFPTRSFTGLSEKPSVDEVDLNDRIGALNVARAMYGEGDVIEAAQVLTTSQLVKEKHPAAMAFLGQLLIESQQFDRFESWVQQVPEASQRYPAYWMARGGWAVHQRKFDVAVAQFAEAIRREPGDLAAIDRITQALAAGGHVEDQARFRRRGVLVDRLMTLTRDVVGASQFDPTPIEEMSTLLTDSGQPAVALAWYRIAVTRMGSPPAAIDQLNNAIRMLDDQEFRGDNLQKQLCGLDLKRFPSGFEIAKSVSDEPTLESIVVNEFPQTIEPVFSNVASEVGLDFTFYNGRVQVKREMRLFEQLGAGVACLDFDLDGRVDFYLGQASCEPPDGRGSRPNVMSRSLGKHFVAVTDSAHCDDRGYTCGITAGDWNQDGFPDLVVGNLTRNSLLINQGDGTFVMHHGDAVWNKPLVTTSLAMGDVDRDQLPDIVEVNYVDDARLYEPIEFGADGKPVRLPAPLDFRPSVDRVFLSVGDGSMAGRRLGNGNELTPATGLGVVVTDLDGQNGNEIFVANDRLANHLWEPQVSSGRPIETTWRDTAPARGIAFGAGGTPQGCMGIAVGDFDQNGRMDLHVTNFENEWNNQYMQDANGFFDDLVVSFGLDQVTYSMLGFGTQAIDYDNNLAVDLVIGNGNVEDYTALGRPFQMPTMLLTLVGTKFVRMNVEGDANFWERPHLSRALATCDWNNDGRMDVAVTDLIEPFALLENRTPTKYRWVQLKMVGTTAERDAIGATVTLSFGGRKITKVVQSGDGYMCKNQAILCFGLGPLKGDIDRIDVRWPDGSEQSWTGVPTGRRWLMIQSVSEPFELDLR
ncbi:MAG: VCBS repeat-containing protein [Planctomycetales bacterium]|nr:VCBS repeat-containing protein [Planctomycetales bacterium]